MKPLSEIGRWVGGGTPSKANPRFWSNGTIPWVSPKDMKTDRIFDTEDHITSEAVENSSTRLVPMNSVLVVVRSGILRHTLPVAIANRDVTVNQDIKGVEVTHDVLPEYVAWALRAAARDILHTCAKGGTTVQNLEIPRFLKYRIPIAPLDEQQRIVAEIEKQFTRLDAGIASLTRSKARVRAYRDSFLNSVFDQPWPQLPISDVGEVVTGSTPPTKDRDNFGDAVPFMKPTDLNAGYRVQAAREHLSLKGARLSTVLPAWTVLVTCIGATIGKTGLARIRCATNQQINALVPNDSLATAKWLFWLLTSPRGQNLIKRNASATTLPIINKRRFENLRFPIPPLAVQKSITSQIETVASVVENTDAVVSANLTRSNKLRQAVLDRAFSGKL